MYKDKEVKFILTGTFEKNIEVTAEIFFKILNAWDINSYSGVTTEPTNDPTKGIKILEITFTKCESNAEIGKIEIREEYEKIPYNETFDY